MSALQAVVVVGVSLVIMAVTIAVMMRMNRASRQQIERRRDAWEAARGVGHCPGDYRGHSDGNVVGS